MSKERLFEINRVLQDLEVTIANMGVCLSPINVVNVPASQTLLVYETMKRVYELSRTIPIDMVADRIPLWEKAEEVERKYGRKLLYKGYLELPEPIATYFTSPDGKEFRGELAGALQFHDMTTEQDCSIFGLNIGDYFYEVYVIEGTFSKFINSAKFDLKLADYEKLQEQFLNPNSI